MTKAVRIYRAYVLVNLLRWAIFVVGFGVGLMVTFSGGYEAALWGIGMLYATWGLCWLCQRRLQRIVDAGDAMTMEDYWE